MSPPRKITRPNNLDTLRLLAALMVVLAHSCVPYPEMRQSIMAHWGMYAVMIFFVISGYLITASWQSHPNLRTFMINRLIRLLPALYTVVLLAFFIGSVISTWPFSRYFSHEVTWDYLGNLLLYPMSDRLPGVFDSNDLLVHGAINGSLWTLRIEFSMYLVVAVLGVSGMLRIWSVSALLLGCAIAFGYYQYIAPEKQPILFFMEVKEVARFGICFMVGALVWLARADWFFHTRTALCAIIITIIAYSTLPHAYPLLFVTLPCIILWLSFCPHITLPRLARYGDMSYGVYIYAFPIQQLYLFYIGKDHGIIIFALTSCIAALICGALSWHLVEKQALRFKPVTMRK